MTMKINFRTSSRCVSAVREKVRMRVCFCACVFQRFCLCTRVSEHTYIQTHIQVCDDYEAEMEDLRQTMDEFFNSQEDWIHRDQLKALTDTIQVTHCSTLQRTTTHCNALQHTATHCNTLQHTATHCNTLQHTTTSSRPIQVPRCSTLQHTTAHCKLSELAS